MPRRWFHFGVLAIVLALVLCFLLVARAGGTSPDVAMLRLAFVVVPTVVLWRALDRLNERTGNTWRGQVTVAAVVTMIMLLTGASSELFR